MTLEEQAFFLNEDEHIYRAPARTGGRRKGFKQSAETKAKISAKMRGHAVSAKTRKLMSEANKGSLRTKLFQCEKLLREIRADIELMRKYPDMFTRPLHEYFEGE